MTATALAPRRSPRARPRASLRRWMGFLHLLARFYMDYERAVLKAAKRKGDKRAVDIDGHRSRQGTGWALHWDTVGKNKLHDPKKIIKKTDHISELTDAQIARLRGPKGQVPQRLSAVLALCTRHHVRAEVELKVTLSLAYLRRLMARPYVKKLDARGDLQFKTLAWMGDPIERLAPAHDAGGTTVLSFTDFAKHHRKPIDPDRAWPVVDFTRGSEKWAA